MLAARNSHDHRLLRIAAATGSSGADGVAPGRRTDKNPDPMIRKRMLTNRRDVLAGAAATAAGLAAPALARAQGGGKGGPLKVGVLLPRSGFEAGIGQDCQRGVEIAPAFSSRSACRSSR